MEIDVAVPIGKKQIAVAQKAIRSLAHYSNPQKINIVSSAETFKGIDISAVGGVEFSNEDTLGTSEKRSECRRGKAKMSAKPQFIRQSMRI